MFQRFEAIGYVGQTPELRYTPDGVAVTDISIATTQTLSKKGRDGPRACPSGWKESKNGKNWEVTTWVRATFWRRLAETVAEYVTKGYLVFVEGILSGKPVDGAVQANAYLNKAGEPAAQFEITASSIKFLSASGARTDVQDGPPPDAETWD